MIPLESKGYRITVMTKEEQIIIVNNVARVWEEHHVLKLGISSPLCVYSFPMCNIVSYAISKEGREE